MTFFGNFVVNTVHFFKEMIKLSFFIKRTHGFHFIYRTQSAILQFVSCRLISEKFE